MAMNEIQWTFECETWRVRTRTLSRGSWPRIILITTKMCRVALSLLDLIINFVDRTTIDLLRSFTFQSPLILEINFHILI